VSPEGSLRAQLLEACAQVAERDRAVAVLTAQNTSLREQLAVVMERLAEGAPAGAEFAELLDAAVGRGLCHAAAGFAAS